LVLSLVLSFPAFAAPKGGTVVSGAADISQIGSVTDINQASQKAVINWQGFSIEGHETVNFNQPSASAMALNRVIGNERSVIDGALKANGQVFIVNSNGLLFGKGASVNAGGLVATTLDISDQDFNNDKFSFKAQKSGGEVVNKGNLTAAENGYVALMGEKVINEGVIVAERGTVSLNGAKKTTLNFNGDSLVNVSLDEGALEALVESKKAIVADGGRVILTAKAADEVVASQVNTDGIIEAKTLGELTGSVEVYAHGGTAKIAGKLDASAPSGGDGGFIETSGDQVVVADEAVVTTKSEKGKSGTWLIDPKDYTIAASGGDMTGQTLSNNLKNNGQVKIESTKGQKNGHGDINVNDEVSWDTNSSLTLTAEGNVNINKAININGSGTLILLPGPNGDYNILTPASYSGAETGPDGYPVARVDTSGGLYGSVNFNGTGGALYIGGTTDQYKYVLIKDLAGLQAINNATGNYALAKNLDLSDKTFTTAVVSTLAEGNVFTGLGHTISNLKISASSGNVGLIGFSMAGTMIRDIGIVNPNIVTTSTTQVGALVGFNISDIKNAYVEGGSVTGRRRVGGLLGYALSDGTPLSIVDVFSTANIKGEYQVGGLIGYLLGSNNALGNNTVRRAHATGSVTFSLATSSGSSVGQLGGLIGNTAGGTIIMSSYATGAVKAEVSSGLVRNLGGLLGYVTIRKTAYSTGTTIENSFATGDVIAGDHVGGLIGYFNAMGNTDFGDSFLTLTNSYATGKVTGTGIGSATGSFAGGLIGYAELSWYADVNLSNVYATGDVEAKGGYIGGLIGYASGDIDSTLTISQAYASGNVTSILETAGPESNAGGLVGVIKDGTIEYSYATGNVTATGPSQGFTAGGLVGLMTANTAIKGSYATGNVSAKNRAGGLVGGSFNQNLISDSYATGIATLVDPTSVATNGVGGLLGSAFDSSSDTQIVNSYWNEANEVGYNVLASGKLTVTESGGMAADQLGDSGILQGIVNGRTPTEVINARAAARVETIVRVAAVADKEQLIGNQMARSGAPEVNLANTESVSLETAIAGYPDQFGTYAGTGNSGPSYSASIQSVTADGVTYFVDEENEDSEQ
jgi:filamentous hemagglutinin family protein